MFQGFLVTPHSFVQVTGALENSGVVVLACTIPPASMIRWTNAAVSVATTSRSGSEPSVLPLPGDRGLLLDRDRQPVQRAGSARRCPRTGLGGLRGRQRLVEPRLRERVDGGLDRLGPRDHGRHQLHRREFLAAELRQRVGRGQVVQVGHGVTAPPGLALPALPSSAPRRGFQPGRGTLARSRLV